jgi:hypothetical protein
MKFVAAKPGAGYPERAARQQKGATTPQMEPPFGEAGGEGSNPAVGCLRPFASVRDWPSTI